MKKLLIILNFLSTVIYAGTMGPITCNKKDITTPCPRYAFILGSQALYLKPFNTQPLMVKTDTIGNQSFKWYNSWQWGLEVDGSLLFGSGKDISATWYHWNNSFQKNFIGTYYTNTSDQFSNPRLHFRPKWDAVNLEFGQLIDFDSFWGARLYGGAHFTQIGLNNTVRTTNTSTSIYPCTASGTCQANIYQTLSSGGPRIGMDLSYDRAKFGFYAKTGISLLIGASKFTGSYNSGSFVVQPSYSGSQNLISPEIDEKLGAQYNIYIPQGIITFNIAWMLINYFDILSKPVYSPLHSGAITGSSFFGNITENQDIGFQGLVIGAKVIANSFM